MGRRERESKRERHREREREGEKRERERKRERDLEKYIKFFKAFIGNYKHCPPPPQKWPREQSP